MIQKDFNLHRLGSLTADLRCIDLFNTNKTDAVIFGYRELTSHNPARRTFMLDLSDLNREDYDELLIEQKRNVIWIHFAVRSSGNRRRTNFKR